MNSSALETQRIWQDNGKIWDVLCVAVGEKVDLFILK